MPTAPCSRPSFTKRTVSYTKVTGALATTLRQKKHRLASRLCGSADDSNGDSDVEMDALKVEHLMASHRSRLGSRMVGRSLSSQFSSSSRPLQSNTSGASLSTMWDRRLGQDVVVAGGLAPSSRRQPWNCCNCGAACEGLEQLCWHCRVHSRCRDCESGLV
ncbi:hypothetical protein PspLS_11369 [Pyricularia sp. CBS 133598]|nr:hypothetical protein PspLS_11369 [Pyricularia sp. CBS 133598]